MIAKEWDIVSFHSKKGLNEIKSGAIVFFPDPDDELKKYIVDVDKHTGMLSIYKSGFADDTIELRLYGSNRFLIR